MYRVSKIKILFRNVAVFLLRGVLAVKIWVFWGAEHIYAITRCLAHVPNLSSLVLTPNFPLYTSEWLFDQRFCYFPKGSSHSKKKEKKVNFHTFGPDPTPPLKSVKLNNFFFLTH